jgi:hypothetical protein
VIHTKETFRYLASGVYAYNQAVHNAPPEARPQMVLPPFWSPVLKHSRPIAPDPDMAGMVARQFEIVPLTGDAIVSHLWLGSWAGMPSDNPVVRTAHGAWLSLGRLKWRQRQRQNPQLAALSIPRPARLYDRQVLVPPPVWPKVTVAARVTSEAEAGALAKIVSQFDYPADQLDVAVLGSVPVAGAAVIGAPADDAIADRNRLAAALAGGEGYVLFTDPRLTDFRPSALRMLLSAGHPVVAANVHMGTQSQSFRYSPQADFKSFYRAGVRDGSAIPGGAGERRWIDQLKGWMIAPLTGVDPALLLVNRQVLAAGVRFAETPYKWHTDGIGFGIMARDNGFEVCGLPDVEARLATAEA